MNMYFGKNLRFLREKHGKPSQEKLGIKLGLTRSAISSYEDGRAEAKYEILNRISKYFNITTDQSDNENIELVPIKASAGYTAGYSDTEYLSELPKYQLPFLPKGKTYRAFEVKGDSMLPLKPKSIVVGEFISDWNTIKDGQVCVVVVKNLNEGIVLKKIYNRVKSDSKFILKSSNINYPSYEIPAEDVIEVWKFSAFISKEFPEENHTVSELKEAFWRLEDDIREIKENQNNPSF